MEQDRADQVTEAELRLAVGRLEEFAGTVRQRLAGADRATQRELILALVRRVEVDAQRVSVVFKVGPSPPGFDQRRSQHRSGRAGRLAPVAGVPRGAAPLDPQAPAVRRLSPPPTGAPPAQRSRRCVSLVRTFLARPLTSSLVSSGGPNRAPAGRGEPGAPPPPGRQASPRSAAPLRCAPAGDAPPPHATKVAGSPTNQPSPAFAGGRSSGPPTTEAPANSSDARPQVAHHGLPDERASRRLTMRWASREVLPAARRRAV